MVAVIVIWGLNWPIMKLGVQDLPPLWFATTRMTLGAICLFAFMAATGELIWPGLGEMPILVSVGLFQIGLPTGLIHFALVHMEAGRSAILVFTIPLWVAPMAVLFLGEKLSAAKIAGLVAGMAGIATLFNPQAFDFADTAQLAGNGLMLAASVSFAIAIILIRNHAWPVPVIRLIPWQMLFGTAILLTAALVVEGIPHVPWSAKLTAIMAYNGPVASAFAFWAWVAVSRDLPAMSTALGSLGVPVVGILASIPILGEDLTLTRVVGLALIGTGVLAVSLHDLNRARRS